MNFVFINPVSKNMYDEKELNRFISAEGFEIVECKTDWIKKVIDKYKQRVSSANKTVMDMPFCRSISKKFFSELGCHISSDRADFDSLCRRNITELWR